MLEIIRLLVDDKFVQRVHALYKLFAGTHDQTVLKEATPEEIVGLILLLSSTKGLRNDIRIVY